jgi:hypothetical protein
MIRRTPPTVDMIAQLVRDTPMGNPTARSAMPYHQVLSYMSTILRCLRSTAAVWLNDAATGQGSPLILCDVTQYGVERVMIRHAEYGERRDNDEHGADYAFDWAPAATVTDLEFLYINGQTGTLTIRNPHRGFQSGGWFVLPRERYVQWRALHTQRIDGQRAVAELTAINNRKRETVGADHDHITAYGRALEDVRLACFFSPGDNEWLPRLAALYEESKQLEAVGVGQAHQPTYRRALTSVAARVLDCAPAEARPLLEGHESLPTTS